MSDACGCRKAASPLTIGGWSLSIPEYCNCAYEVIDRYAKEDPEKVAMIWVNQEGDEKRFTFADLSRLSNQAANMLLAKGIRKGALRGQGLPRQAKALLYGRLQRPAHALVAARGIGLFIKAGKSGNIHIVFLPDQNVTMTIFIILILPTFLEVHHLRE